MADYKKYIALLHTDIALSIMNLDQKEVVMGCLFLYHWSPCRVEIPMVYTRIGFRVREGN